MKRTMIMAAAAAALFALSAQAPAQASMANPGLSSAASPLVQDVQYRYDRRDHRSWRHHRRSRHCWTVRVRTWGHHWRYVRRCGWR
jgi:hypothetical protein